jgi:hypothetical protein
VSILNVWFTDHSVYKTLGNNGLCVVGVVCGMITVLWYIPLVTVSVLFGAFLVTVVRGGDSTRYYVTLQATRVRSAYVVSCNVIVHNCTHTKQRYYYCYSLLLYLCTEWIIYIFHDDFIHVKSIGQL